MKDKMNNGGNNLIMWARHLHSISKNGMLYSKNGYDHERYNIISDIASEMYANISNYEPIMVQELFNTEIGYNTPKVESRGVVFKDNSILFVRENDDGLWSIPGGMVDQNETPRQAVEREVEEETGYHVKAEKLLALMDRDSHSHYPPHPFSVFKIFISCKIIGGKPRKSFETDEIKFFKENEIPELSISRITEHQIRRMFEHLNDLSLPTDLD